MAVSTITKNKRDGTITFSDNAGANSITVAYEEGDLSITVPGESVSHYLDRGRITSTPSIRYLDDQPVTFTFSANLRDVSDATDEILTELILGPSGRIGTNWVSTMGANGEVFTVTTLFTIEGTDHGDAADHTLTMNFCRLTGSIAEGDPDTISISGTAYDLYPTPT